MLLLPWHMQLVQWDQSTFVSSLGPLAEDLIRCGIESYSGKTLRLEEHFSKICPMFKRLSLLLRAL